MSPMVFPNKSVLANHALYDVVEWLGFSRAAVMSYCTTLVQEREQIFLRARDA